MTAGAMRIVVLDSEAVSAIAARRLNGQDWQTAARADGARFLIPSVVLAELMTGGPRDAGLWHVANRIDVVDIDKPLAANAGALRERAEQTRRKKRDLTVAAIVASVAVDNAPSVVLTADPDDFRALVAGHDVVVEPISSA